MKIFKSSKVDENIFTTFAKILYLSKMGEIALTISKGVFSPNLSKLPDLDETMAW